jgi:hypothetical protein
VIPVIGIEEETMFWLDGHLLSLVGVNAVLQHRETGSHGRWNIQTTTAHFNSTIEVLKKELSGWVAKIRAENRITVDDNLPEVAVAFKSRAPDDNSDGSYKSFVSAWTNMFSVTEVEGESEDDLDQPPSSSRPVTHTWEIKIPSVFQEPTTEVDLPVRQSLEMDRLMRDNERVTKENVAL